MPRITFQSVTVVAAIVGGVAILAGDPLGSSASGGTATPDAATVAALNERTHQIATRIAYKDSLMRELIAGRTTLTDVAAEFLRLNQDEAVNMSVLRQQFPCGNDEERSACNVIQYLYQRGLPAAEEARVLGRLEDEFARNYGHTSGVKP